MARTVMLLNETKDRGYGTLISRLSSLENVLIIAADNPKEFDKFLRENPVHVLIFVVDLVPSEEFLQVVSKGRYTSGFRDGHIIAVHKRFADIGIQKSLMAGAKSIYLEPIEQDKIFFFARSLLDGTGPGLGTLSSTSNIAPMSCSMEVYGRVGKLFLEPMGDLQVEIDAKLTQGQTVKVQSLMAKEQGVSEFTFAVESATTDDTYYHYRNSYRLSGKHSDSIKAGLAKWIESKKKTFALPKTKVLWIRENPLGELEDTLNKTVFSVHVQAPSKVTRGDLSKLSPRVVIVDQVSEDLLKLVESWIDGKIKARTDTPANAGFSAAPILITTTQIPSERWHYLPSIDVQVFRTAFTELVKPRLIERVSAASGRVKYLDRKSNYSRFALSLGVKLIRIERSYLTIDAEIELELNTIFYLSVPPLPADKARSGVRAGCYLKVMRTEFIPKSYSYRHICEIVPISDQPGLFLGWWKRWVDAQVEYVGEEGIKKEGPGEDRIAGPAIGKGAHKAKVVHQEAFFLEAPPSRIMEIGIDLGKVVFGLVIAAIIAFVLVGVFPKSQSKPAMPTSMKDAIQGIHDAFH